MLLLFDASPHTGMLVCKKKKKKRFLHSGARLGQASLIKEGVVPSIGLKEREPVSRTVCMQL